MIIQNILVYNPACQFEKGSIRMENARIVDVCYGDMWITQKTGEQVVDGQGCFAIPGLTDIHFHGCCGVDFCNGTEKAIETMALYEASKGVTSICPATMTVSEEELMQVCRSVSRFVKRQLMDIKQDGDMVYTNIDAVSAMAILCGMNMEGPFISASKKGAQNEAFIRTPDVEMFHRLQNEAGGYIKLVDIAPETENAMTFIETVKDEVRVSLAHTTADYDTAAAAFYAGAKHVTHLYNAIPPFIHRNPGVVGAACDQENVTVELICDGLHVHPAVVRTTFKMFGDDRIILISDSMEATGMPDGKYQLGGQEVFVEGKRAALSDGTIAGSATNLMDCMKTAVKEMHIPFESAVKCAAVNSAKAIGVYDRFGSIEKGKAANVVLLDKELNTKAVYMMGRKIG